MQPFCSKKGNRCDHNKNNFKRPSFLRNAKRRPHVLEEAKRRISDAILDNFKYPELTRLFYHSAADGGSGRHRRSERIEGIFSLALPTLLQTLNLHRMACGAYNNRNEFQFFNYAYLQDKSDQNSSRFKREMAILQKEEFIKVTTRREPNNDGTWRTIEVRIEFTDRIFEILDLMSEFLADREYTSIKFFKKQSKINQKKAKDDFYRVQKFNKSNKPKKIGCQDLSVAVKNVAQTFTKPIMPIKSNNGVEIRDKIRSLVDKGISVKDAIAAVKQQYPPPH
jgi:hypothetical protein